MRAPYRHLAVVIAFLFIIVASLHAQSDANLARQGDTLMKQGKLKEAITYYDKAIQANKQEYRYFHKRGLARLGMGELDKAKEDYLAALALDAGCGECLVDLGSIELANGNHRAALKFLNSGIALEKSALAYFRRAQAREALGDDIEALIDYNYAIQYDSTTIEFRIGKGTFYANAKNMEMAREIFDDVIRRDPKSAAGYFHRARTYYDVREWGKAAEDLRRAIELDPTGSDAYLALGSTFWEMGRFQDAKATHDTLIARFPNNAAAYYYRSASRYKLEDMDGSCDDMGTALALLKKNEPRNGMIDEIERGMTNHCDSTFPSYYVQRGIAAYNLNDFDAAVAAYDRGLVRFKKSPILYFFRGNANLAGKHYSEAIRDYNAALADMERLVEEYNMALPQQENMAELRSVARGAVSLSIYQGLADSKLALGNIDGAVGDVTKSIEGGFSIPGVSIADLHMKRGELYMVKGDYRNALADFDKSIEQAPSAAAYLNRALAFLNIAEQQPIETKVFIAGVNGNNSTSAPMTFSLPYSVKRVGDNGELRQAVAACTRAIELDPMLGQAYSLRGYIRLRTGSSDACADLEKARSLDVPGAAEMMKENCR
jgi:tetratricopeptide (TPR) repeat protein